MNRNRHSLIQLIFNSFSSWRLNLIKIYSIQFWFRSSLTLHSISFVFNGFNFFMSWKCFPHVLVPLILFAYQMISCSDMIVSVCFHTPYGVFLFKIKIIYKLLKQFFVPRHFLKTWKQAWLTRYWINACKVCFHKSMISNVLNSISCFWVSI